MRLDRLLADSAVASAVEGGDAVEITDLTYDHRAVGPGALHVCVRGARVDGHDFASAAAANGAAALVVERAVDIALPQVVVADSRAAMARLADAFFGRPTERLRVAGVTGTNGKTTTTFLLASIFEAAGLETGLLGTVERRVGGAVEAVARTTPEAIDLQRTFRRMLDAGDVACAIEVSSHALALRRVEGVRFAAAAFTNLSQDHLDFHGSLDRYFAAKASLFDGRCPRAVNVDDPHGRTLPAEVTFAVESPADIRAECIVLDRSGSAFTLVGPFGRRDVRIALPGAFNISNALAAASVALLLDVPADAIVAGLAALPGVPGRMEAIAVGQPFAVIVDYAHTPDALARVLTAARDVCDRRLRVVFGCGGDRDREKRPQMGRVASDLADDVIVTNDNPRSENPAAIAAQVVSGATRGVRIELDRRSAIAQVLATSLPGDVVVIAGKGHERGQETGGVVAPFDDREVVRELLA